MHTKKRHKSCHDEKPKFETYRYWKPKICQNGHKFWVQAYTTIKYIQRQPQRPIEPASDLISGTPEGIRGTPERIPKFCGTPERIRITAPHLPNETQYKMCSQKQFLDSPHQLKPDIRTNMGPNNRQEAILEVQRDILDSLKKLSKYTTDMSMQKLHQMPFDVFERKQSALPQFKRLYKRTLRATRDGQKLAPRNTKHEFYYRLFEEFVFLLDMQNDQLLEIEETMDSLVELHEYRKQTLTQQTHEFKPVKDRPPTPLPRPNLRMILRNVDLTLAHSSSKSKTPPPASPSGYSSSSSSSSGKTTTTTSTTTTTTVRHNWGDSDDSDDSSTRSRQSQR